MGEVSAGLFVSGTIFEPVNVFWRWFALCRTMFRDQRSEKHETGICGLSVNRNRCFCLLK